MAIISEEIGDIFAAPPKSILIHACNARGAWGSGVAVAFKQKYPYAFRKYNAHCLSPPTGSKLSVKQHQANIVGTTLLIPPPSVTNQRQASKTPHYIACLFTSLDYGKRVSPPEEILENTGNALKDLAKNLAEIRGLGEEVGNCHAVRINSGKFGVEWQKTKAVLEAGDLDITVVRPEGEEKAEGAGGKLRQPPAKGEKAQGKKPPAGTSAREYNPPASIRAKAESPFDKQMNGVKRKVEKDPDEDGDEHREDLKGQALAQLHPGIAKRRKRLCLDR
ncbi:MAG: ADP-ribose 1''-phosphate phosphatase [Alectoria sarmentosa]|nr:MAG: ADP-ribose 1''-phosphate phosphatase [Alectoria sarmentosa]